MGNDIKPSKLDNYERFGMHLSRKDQILHYISYLKGMQAEFELGDLEQAKANYIDSLTCSTRINHRIRKNSLQRLLTINAIMGVSQQMPERMLMQKYCVTRKAVQVLFDASSFQSNKSLRNMMNLPKMIYNNLGPDDQFGLKILKNGFDTQEYNHVSHKRQHHIKNVGYSNQCDPDYLDVSIELEVKSMNERIKVRYFDDLTKELI